MLTLSGAAQTGPMCVCACMSAHVRHVNRSAPPCNHTNCSSMPLLGLAFQTNTPWFARHHRNCLGTILMWQPGHYATLRRRKKNLGNIHGGREVGSFVSSVVHNCAWENQKNLMINRLWADQRVLGMVKVVKMLSRVCDVTAELVFYSGNQSQNDATWEKNNKEPGLLY